MILCGFPASPNTWRVRAFADHIGVPLDFRFVDLMKQEQKKPEFLAISPVGRTPALQDGDFNLWESNAIMQYIASKKPNDLWPDDAQLRADIMRWQSWQMCHLFAACEPLVFQRIVKAFMNLGAPDEGEIAKAEVAFAKEGGLIDAHLARHRFLVADRLTLADFAVGAYFLHAEAARYPLDALPNLRRWSGEVLALPAWKNTAPPRP